MKTLIIGLLLLSSCANQRKVILVTPVVSMSKYSLKPNQKVIMKDEIEGKFCAEAFRKSGSYGLIDEAIKDAQRKSRADFIYDATVSQQGHCTFVSGTAAHIKK